MSIPISPRKVITRSDVRPSWRVVSIDNSILARFSEDVDKLKSHPQSIVLRRLLNLMASRPLRQHHRVQFVVSQALYYDRSKEKGTDESAVRLLAPLFIARYTPEDNDVIMEWPVARVEQRLCDLPRPTETRYETQDGLRVELRVTPMTQRTDQTAEMRAAFNVASVTVGIPLCVYDPGVPEDEIAQAFGFSDFAAVSPRLIGDVCHAASHHRLTIAGDVLLVNDSDFDKSALARVGVNCMKPEEFMDYLDPTGAIEPVTIRSDA